MKSAFFLAFLASIGTTEAIASSCCAGSSAFPALISGDHAAQVSAAFNHRVPSTGTRTQPQAQVSAATLLSDRWQAGAAATAAQTLGDLKLNAAYEAWPEYTYSVWKPRGYVFAQLTAPTGTSPYSEPGLVSPLATGEGFWTASAGTLFLKQGSMWDASVSTELHASKSQGFDNPDFENLRVSQQWGAGASLGMGLSPGGGNLRLGVRGGLNYRAPFELRWLDGAQLTSPRWEVPFSFEATYLLQNLWSVSASFGAPNSFNQVLSVSLQKRWDR